MFIIIDSRYFQRAFKEQSFNSIEDAVAFIKKQENAHFYSTSLK